MKQIILDGTMMRSRQDAHKYLAKQFQFPHYSRYNLEALWKMLLNMHEPMEIEIKNSQIMLARVPDYGMVFLRMLLEAGQVNENIKINYE